MKKILRVVSFLPYLPKTIWFNFHYLPFRQAMKLPIHLRKVKLSQTKGTVLINTQHVTSGMIRLGFHDTVLFPDRGLVWENHGGKVAFNGTCRIGNDSAISVGPCGRLSFGDRFSATALLKLICYHSVTFKDYISFSWECTVMDSDMHSMICAETGKHTKGYAPVTVGAHNWIGCRCTLLKGTETPDYCTVAACTVLNKKIGGEKYQIVANASSEIKCVKTGFYRDLDNDTIEYSK